MANYRTDNEVYEDDLYTPKPQHKTNKERRQAVAPSQRARLLAALREGYGTHLGTTVLCQASGGAPNSILSRVSELKREGWRILGGEDDYGCKGLSMAHNEQVYTLLSLDQDAPYEKHVGGHFLIDYRQGNGGWISELHIDQNCKMPKHIQEELRQKLQALLDEYNPAQFEQVDVPDEWDLRL